MKEKVCKYIQSMNMLEQGDRVVVGLSGGADSVALLLVLQEMRREMKLELFAVHINHGIRAEAEEDSDYARRLCEKLRIPFFLFEADIPVMAKRSGRSEEEMGRIYRYQSFGEVMEQVNADKLAVAHHMDDQAETMLFHLIRGSRIAGMSGMKPVTPFSSEYDTVRGGGDKRLIRPLLCVRKNEITAWLKAQNTDWREDCTNEDNTYSRNCIRNKVIPVLESVNAQAVNHMAELAEEMTGYKMFLQKMVESYLELEVEETKTGDLITNREKLSCQEDILKKAVIYEMLVRVCGKKKDISGVHVRSVELLLGNQSGRQLSLPYEMEAEVSYEKLIIRKCLQVKQGEPEVLIQPIQFELQDCLGKVLRIALPENRCILARLYLKNQCVAEEWENLVQEAVNSKNNYTKFYDCDTIKDTLRIRTAEQNDYFVLNDALERKKVSRYFMDEKIPISQRKRVLVLAMGNQVLWILGRRRCESYKVSADSEAILKLMYEGE